MIGNYRFYPSQIEDAIYDLMEDYQCGIDVYDCGLIDAISDYFCNHAPIVQWRLSTSLWPNMEGGLCAVSWIENDNLNMIMFDYKV